MRLLLAFALLALLRASPALAWGAPGHEVIAAIAEHRLSPQARRFVQDVIGDESLADPDIATWADAHRDRTTGPWHYVNIPLRASAYDPQRDCARGCAVKALHAALETLAGAHPRAERTQALRWVVHLVADIHQPLHAGDGLDRGGNTTPVRIGRRRQPTNLHAVWDADVVRPLLEGGGITAASSLIESHIDPAAADRWAAQVAPAAWATESHLRARAIYQDLDAYPGEGRLLSLPADYPIRQRVLVVTAMAQAAVRLAAALEEAAQRHG